MVFVVHHWHKIWRMNSTANTIIIAIMLLYLIQDGRALSMWMAWLFAMHHEAPCTFHRQQTLQREYVMKCRFQISLIITETEEQNLISCQLLVFVFRLKSIWYQVIEKKQTWCDQENHLGFLCHECSENISFVPLECGSPWVSTSAL